MIDVPALFPEALAITDEALRRDTVALLERCLKESQWDSPESAAFTPEIPAERFDGVHHVRAVTGVACAIASQVEELLGVTVDRDRLVSACLLHDASKWLEYEPGEDGAFVLSEFGRSIPHAAYIAALALEAGLPAEIVEAITTHTPQNALQPSSAIGVILHHADMIVADCCRLSVGLPARGKAVDR